MVLEIARRFINGEWKTTALDDDGGGGSLPSQWTVGPEGELKITPDPGGIGDVFWITDAGGLSMLQVACVDALNGDGRVVINDLGTFFIDTNGEAAASVAENGVFVVGGTTQVPSSFNFGSDNCTITLSTGAGVFQVQGQGPVEIMRIEEFHHYVEFKTTGGQRVLVLGDDGMGFFGATQQAKPTGVAVTAAGIHAALVTLGLIAA